MRFVSLHTHSTFSHMDGIGTPRQHVERVADLGMSAIAFTEHGGTSSHVQAMKAGLDTGVKFIPGLEAYTALGDKEKRKFHLTLLAMDQVGLASLYKLVTLSWENFYSYPTVTGQMLSDCSDGLICLSGCSDSLLSCSLLGGKSIEPDDASPARARRVASMFKEVFGDRYYLETQAFPELPRAHQLNPWFADLSEELSIPLAATLDVHTLVPGQGELRALIHAAGRGTNTISAQMSSWDYTVNSTYMSSDQEVIEALETTKMSKAAAEAAVYNTEEIAERCNVTLPKADLFEYKYTPGEERWLENESTGSKASIRGTS